MMGLRTETPRGAFQRRGKVAPYSVNQPQGAPVRALTVETNRTPAGTRAWTSLQGPVRPCYAAIMSIPEENVLINSK